VDVVRLINNLICALGSLTVALAMLVLLWLPGEAETSHRDQQLFPVRRYFVLVTPP